MHPIVEFILVTIVSFLNTLDKCLQAVGVKLRKLDKKSVTSRLPVEYAEEAKSKDIALPFELFLDGLGKDQMLDFWRRIEISKQLEGILHNRIEIRKALQVNPDILKIPIRKPIFILGLPRSGTTHLFNLLSQAEDVTSPLLWQMFAPTPPGKPQNWRTDPRFIKLERGLNILRALGHKHADVAHVSRADGPEECAVILRYSMAHGQHVLRLPTLDKYRAWYYSRDLEQFEEMYRFYRKVLQIIAYGEDMTKKRYLLKCIWHCLGIEALHKVFPDACIIYNYRDLENVVPSACSMSHRTTYAWGPPDEKYGKRIVESLKQYTDKVTNYLKKLDNKPKGENQVFVLDYNKLVKNPIGTVKSIHEHFDLEVTDASINNMEQYLKANPQNKHGKHTYSLSEYNLEMGAIKEEFQEYIQYMSEKIRPR